MTGLVSAYTSTITAKKNASKTYLPKTYIDTKNMCRIKEWKDTLVRRSGRGREREREEREGFIVDTG
jgi:hypothetical protein